MQYELNFLKSLLLTVIIETAVLIISYKLFAKDKANSTVALLFTGVLASCATLPYLWFIFPLFIKSSSYYHLFSELFAFVSEVLIIKYMLRINYKLAIIFSLACNAISYITGLLLFN